MKTIELGRTLCDLHAGALNFDLWAAARSHADPTMYKRLGIDMYAELTKTLTPVAWVRHFSLHTNE